ncbi:MAG: hypothetical protein V9G14_00730 [Cypionkella sp.]
MHKLADHIAAGGYGAVAIGFIHSYLNPAHEQRARATLSRQKSDCRFPFLRKSRRRCGNSSGSTPSAQMPIVQSADGRLPGSPVNPG